MLYAIVEISGKQLWVQPGRFYDVNKIKGNPGETILLNKVLLLNKEGEVLIGRPCVQDMYIKAKILKHLRGRKITAFKAKPKKNVRVKKGHRQQLTRLLIQGI
uniref:50S ribosomal protein L21, chloroplastic n=1 Tax=Rhodogorgon sp. TaxID=2485824 RepID=A0A3G3MIC8_9FLOR|nr:ribosomal protein L21 [Rhodogorgon sp.]